MTLLEAVEQAAARLQAAGLSFGHGTQNAFDEAAWLLLWRLGLPLDTLEQSADQSLSSFDADTVQRLVDLRIHSRRPTPYLTGEAWLQGLPFFVDERCIVPRSLIAEVLADGAIDSWLGQPPTRVLDLCTGNGSLAVMAALAWPQAQVLATDLSADALVLARRNVRRHQLQSQVSLAQGDGLAAATGTFDLVICNPPYVNTRSMQDLPPEYRAEPALALAGGEDGMNFIRPLLQSVARHLNPQGMLVLEIGFEREHFEAAFPRLPLTWLPTQETEDQVLLLQAGDLMTLQPSPLST